MTRLAIFAAFAAACSGTSPAEGEPNREDTQTMDDRRAERAQMVSTQLEGRDITDPRVLEAMRAVPRHRFVPAEHAGSAYDDRPLPIGHDVTISQPYIVALMSQLADVGPGEKVLEVGTGSGYQAAVLDEMGAEVSSIEIIEPLAVRARSALEATGHGDVRVRAGDGYAGWPEHAPFDAILITAAPPTLPQPLLDQLAVGGRLVAPVGTGVQRLQVVQRTEEGLVNANGIQVRFVPMTGRAQDAP